MLKIVHSNTMPVASAHDLVGLVFRLPDLPGSSSLRCVRSCDYVAPLAPLCVSAACDVRDFLPVLSIFCLCGILPPCDLAERLPDSARGCAILPGLPWIWLGVVPAHVPSPFATRVLATPLRTPSLRNVPELMRPRTQMAIFCRAASSRSGIRCQFLRAVVCPEHPSHTCPVLLLLKTHVFQCALLLLLQPHIHHIIFAHVF